MKGDAARTLLAVHDDPGSAETLREALGETYLVSSANSGEQALALIGMGFVPDLILLDMALSPKNAYELLEKIKQNPPLRDIPVLFLARPGGAANEIRALEMGAADYMTKPFVPEVLRARLAARLKNSLEIRHFRKTLGGERKKADPFPPLTPWERKIALLAQQRYTVREMAKAMKITENTAKSALKNIYGKLDVHSKLQLANLDLGD
jgi:DNA-binding NarL/FixJ family response regulator